MTNGYTSPSARGYDTFYQYAKRSAFVARQWVVGANQLGASEVGLIRLENVPAGHYSHPPVSDYALQYIMKGNCHANIELGKNKFQGVIQRGRFIFAPPETHTNYEVCGPFSVLILGLKSETFKQANAALKSDIGTNFKALHTTGFKDKLVQQLAIALWSEAQAGNPLGAQYADHMIFALAVQLLKLSDRISAQVTKSKPLDEESFGKVRNAMEEQIGKQVTLADLAAIVSMDVYQFSRAFRARTGQSPYSYLLSKRVRKVEGMLAKSNLSLSEIAYACGFSSQSHMTSAFSNVHGTSPGAYRRELPG
ncbi:MAG: AraC family transcriptional regulator [Pseudomonadota bacterium]